MFCFGEMTVRQAGKKTQNYVEMQRAGRNAASWAMTTGCPRAVDVGMKDFRAF